MRRSATLARPVPGTESILVPEGLGVYPLSRVHPVRIGRSPRSDLVIPISAVSRRHALVEWRRGSFHIRDLLSRNGTRVNGRRISCRRLRAGDRIDIGGLPVRFGEREGGRSRRTILGGDLRKVRLQEIIPFLVTQSRSGILEVQGDVRGEVHFADGVAVHARTGPLVGEEAFFRILEADRGSFVLHEGPIRIQRTVRRSAVALILESSRRVDEREAG